MSRGLQYSVNEYMILAFDFFKYRQLHVKITSLKTMQCVYVYAFELVIQLFVFQKEEKYLIRIC